MLRDAQHKLKPGSVAELCEIASHSRKQNPNSGVVASASVYGKEEGGADTAVWLAEDRGSLSSDSVAHQTIVALRELGVLDGIIATKEGLVVYPAGMNAEEWETA